MSEKQFELLYELDENIESWEILDKESQTTISDEMKIVELLNTLHDKNKKLERREMIYLDKIRGLMK